MEEKLIKELNSLLIKKRLEDWEKERIEEIEAQLEELQDLSYDSLNGLTE